MSDEVLFATIVDRASPNGLAAAWIAEQFSKPPRQFYFWIEHCPSHGCAIAKSMSKLMNTSQLHSAVSQHE